MNNLKNKAFQKKSLDNTYTCSKCKDTGRYWVTDDKGIEYVKDCECGLRQRQIMENRLKFANIPDNYKTVGFDNYKTDMFLSDADNKLSKNALDMVKKYYEHFDELKADGKGLYMFSTCKGSGKTRLALSLANELMHKKNVSVKFATSLQIINEIKATFSNNEYQMTEKKLMEQLVSAEVLIIDDFGTERTTGFVQEKFYDLINGRYINSKPTILTSNYNLKTIDYDDRIVDRLREKNIIIEFPSHSIREILADKNELEFKIRS